MTPNEKILKWEAEIHKIKEAQREYLESSNKKIKSLQKKINDEKVLEQQKYERTVVDIVKKVFGEFNDENLSKFENMMKEMNENATTKA